MNEITINWHILERCNYSCDYCFAKYANSDKKEIHNSKESIEFLLEKVYHYFTTKYNGYSIRLNIAGGEPMLSKNLDYIIEVAYRIGFKISLITNASKLTSRFIRTNAKHISMFAISIDSINNKVNIKIGRSFKNNTLSISKIFKHLEELKKMNPLVKIKINTVVNKYNYKNYLGDIIDLINPFKWKVLQALSLTDEVFCSDEQYKMFLINHQNINTKISQESNNDMRDSYIMLDPYGRFYQNTFGKYNYSKSILDVDIEKAFESIKFDFNKFIQRYSNEI
jgi:radical S-adenosyl methionine domain-containing protein 2